MKTVQVLLFISTTIAAAGCKNTNSMLDDGLREIQVFSSSPYTIRASELFDLEGFVTLAPSESAPLRSIRKAVFSNGKIIILDNRTDFQNLYVFDEKTGIFLNKIGHQSESQGGYNELYDIVPEPGKNNITGLVAGKMAFMTYDLSGNLLSTLPNGMYGQQMAILPDGGYVVYNEFGATDISGKYHLVYYDNKGNLIKRALPYPESSDGWGYEYTGFLTSAGHQIWFNPPFSDTVFSLSKNRITPVYVLDFKGKEVPVELRKKKLTGWDTDNNAFLYEGFVTTGQYAVFHIFDEQKTSLCVFDNLSGNFYNARNFREDDWLYPLVQVGDVFQKSETSFALVLEPRRIRHMMANNKINMEELGRRHPDLAQTLADKDSENKYILLYFSTRPVLRRDGNDPEETKQ
ncbi:MAG: 6-bladed beta-propeller [Lewinellaceae bacterium]|nr:6-bladed beta-propeller [Lewinellaceae bacterium]